MEFQGQRARPISDFQTNWFLPSVGWVEVEGAQSRAMQGAMLLEDRLLAFTWLFSSI